MANQISLFFESQPTRDEAVAGVFDHIRRFWDPRMRDAIIKHAESGDSDLREIAGAAVARLAAERAESGTRAA
jgi:formate dehydrogenase subunit delta